MVFSNMEFSINVSESEIDYEAEFEGKKCIGIKTDFNTCFALNEINNCIVCQKHKHEISLKTTIFVYEDKIYKDYFSENKIKNSKDEDDIDIVDDYWNKKVLGFCLKDVDNCRIFVQK